MRRLDFVAHTTTVPDYFLNSLQDFIQNLAANFVLKFASSTSIKVEASSDEVAAIAVGGKWRFKDSTVSAAHPGGGSGDYDIYVTASDDDFSGSEPTVDLTDYDFGLEILPDSSTPSTDLYRKIATCHYNGTTITSIEPIVGGVSADYGVGDEVTQGGGRTNDVTINKSRGTVKTDATNASGLKRFTVHNNRMAEIDGVILTLQNNDGKIDWYNIAATAAGSFDVAYFMNANSSRQYEFNFRVVDGSIG